MTAALPPSRLKNPGLSSVLAWVSKSLPVVSAKACNESYEEQLLTAGILLNKVLFFSKKRTRL